MLATTSLGAIWTSTSPDFGVESVNERFGQVKPKVLFTCDGYTFNGKTFDMTDKNREIIEHSKRELKQVCQVGYLKPTHDLGKSDLQKIKVEHGCRRSQNWQDIITQLSATTASSFTRVSFNEPIVCFVLFRHNGQAKMHCLIPLVAPSSIILKNINFIAILNPKIAFSTTPLVVG